MIGNVLLDRGVESIAALVEGGKIFLRMGLLEFNTENAIWEFLHTSTVCVEGFVEPNDDSRLC